MDMAKATKRRLTAAAAHDVKMGRLVWAPDAAALKRVAEMAARIEADVRAGRLGK
jgi:hypothetical protein